MMDQLETIRLLLQEAPDAVYWTRQDGSFGYVNRVGHERLGYTREALLALRIFDVDIDLDPDSWHRYWQESIRHETITLERRHRHKDGPLVPVEVKVRPVVQDGEPLHFSFVRDLRDQRRLEVYKKLIDHLPIGIFRTTPGPEGSIVTANQALAQILEFRDAEALIGARPVDFYAKRSDRRMFSTRVQDRGEISRMEVELITARNNRIHVALTAHRSLDENGQTVFDGAMEDITESRITRQQQRQVLERFQNAIEHAPIPIMLHRADGAVETVNRVWCELSGYSRKQLQTIEDWTRLAYGKRAQAVIENVARLSESRGPTDEGDFEITCADGTQRVWRFNSAPLEGADSSNRLIMSAAMDVTLEKQQHERMRQAETIIQSALEGIIITDAERNIERVNPSFTRITGYSAEEVVGKNPRILSSGRQDRDFYRRLWAQIERSGHWQGEIWNRRKNGEIYPEWLSIMAIHNRRGETVNYAGIFTDLTELKRSQSSLERLQRFDPLTGLLNREAISEFIQQHIERGEAAGPLITMLCGLDRFHRLNESFSYAVGDQVLKTLAARLEQFSTSGVEVARVGSDRFVVVLRGTADDSATSRLIAAIQQRLCSPIELENQPPITVQSSTGIARYPEDGSSALELLRNAETAMFHAKQHQRGRLAWFDPVQSEKAQQKLLLEIELRKALENKRLDVHFQPLVRIIDNQIIGAEALARWSHPERGMISPELFIGIAEESGLIGELSAQLLARAAEGMAEIQKSCDTPLLLAFNISATQINDAEFAGSILEALTKAGLRRDLFELELTESTLMSQAAQPATTLKQLTTAGIRISIDDFGTGFSSLAYLQDIHAHTLKIDQRFVNEIESGGAGKRIVASIVAMAQALGMRVVAEGVETDAQLDYLREIGCDYYQGYLFSKPVPIDEFAGLFRCTADQPS